MALLEITIDYITKFPLALLESLCVLVPIIIGVTKWSKLSLPIKLVVVNFILLLVLDIPLWIMAIQGIHNYHISNLQELLASSLLLYIIYLLLESFNKNWLYIVLGIYLIVAIYDFNWEDYSSWIFSYPRALFIILSFIFFNELLNKLEIKNLLLYSNFWLFTGILLSSTGTLLMFFFINYFSHTQGTKAFNSAHYIKDISKYVFVILSSVAIILDNKHINFKI
jgi:hypothetical protein